MASYTNKIKIGNSYIGGSKNIIIQSMTNTKTEDIEKTVTQILELEKAGCEIVRIAIPNEDAANAITQIKEKIAIPLVADIHFDYKLALKSIENGIDKLRINPGNIGDEFKINKVVDAANAHKIPIRIGVNGGSLDKKILEKYKHPTSNALVESALYHVELLEKRGFNNIIISMKSSDVQTMYRAYKKMSRMVDYPLHLGVTEAGSYFEGAIKSSIGIGSLLLDDIGDTIRVSLTENPVEEIVVAKKILEAIGLREKKLEIISCPTCGRTEIDLISLAKKVENEFKNYDKKIKIAVMGCVVNGPGEAKEADFGIAGSKGYAVIFKKGEVVKKVDEDCIIDELKKLIVSEN